MKCPSCGNDCTEVRDSRPVVTENMIRRRRRCPECGNRFTTFEVASSGPESKTVPGAEVHFALAEIDRRWRRSRQEFAEAAGEIGCALSVMSLDDAKLLSGVAQRLADASLADADRQDAAA